MEECSRNPTVSERNPLFFKTRTLLPPRCTAFGEPRPAIRADDPVPWQVFDFHLPQDPSNPAGAAWQACATRDVTIRHNLS